MADDTRDAGAPAAGSNIKLIILIVLGLAIIGGGGGAAWFLMGNGSEDAHGSQGKTASNEATKEATHDEPGPIVDLAPFVLNLADRDVTRYLKMTVKVELDRPEEETDFEKRIPAIRDALLVLLTSKESLNIRTVNGKRRLREEIRARTNRLMKKGKITNVFFTDFIIQ